MKVSDRAAIQQVSILMATVFIDMVGFLVVLPLLPFYAERMGGTPALVGALVSVFALAQLVTSPFWGRFSDRLGRRPIILGGLVVSALAYVLFGLAESVEVLFLSRIVQGAGGGTTGVVQAYVADSFAPADRAKALGWVTSATSAGVMIGPLVGSFATYLGPQGPGFLAAGLCVLNFLFAWRWLPEPRRHAASSTADEPRSLGRAAWEVLRHPGAPVSSLVWIYAFGMMAFMAMNGILALYLDRAFGITEKTIGWFYTYVGGVSLVMRALLLGRAVRRFGEVGVTRLGALSLAAGLATIPLAHVHHRRRRSPARSSIRGATRPSRSTACSTAVPAAARRCRRAPRPAARGARAARRRRALRRQGRAAAAVANVRQRSRPSCAASTPATRRRSTGADARARRHREQGRLGANAILGVSLAVAKAAADAAGLPLYAYLGGPVATVLPVPMLNVLNGGAHADNSVDIQEFMIVPIGFDRFSEALRAGVEVYHPARRAQGARHGHRGRRRGRLRPQPGANREALDLLVAAIEGRLRAGREMALALDVAASELVESTRQEEGHRYALAGEGRRAVDRRRPDRLAAALPRHPRRPRRLHLRRRPLDAPAAGGTATRLTAHPGLELFARFSPDGRWIAFTGQYDGDEQVYVVPATGGEPKQLTFYPARGPLTPRWGYDNQVYGWTPTASVLFRSLRDSWTLPVARLYTVPVDGGPAGQPLPMPESGAGDYSPDGNAGWSTRRCSATSAPRSATGRPGQRLFLFDLAERGDAHRSTTREGHERDPMWIGDASTSPPTRRHVQPLRVRRRRAAQTRQVTRARHLGRALAERRRGEGRIVYELAGELHVLDTRERQQPRISITCPTTASPAAVARVGGRPDLTASRSARRASARCSWPAATSSRRRSRRARRAT
jgi:multidrug resistance protein